MASGKRHTQSGIAIGIVQLPIAVVTGQFGLVYSAIGTIVGAWMIGPDLDVPQSLPSQRWLMLKFIWWPYQWALPHRSFLSHCPIVGTVLRVLYLAGLFYICNWLLLQNNYVNAMYVIQYPEQTAWFIIGLCINDALHWFYDGCPFRKLHL